MFQNKMLEQSLKLQIDNVISEVSDHFDKFNQQINTEKEQSEAFISLIFTALFKSLMDEQVRNSGINEENIDAKITKFEVMQRVQNMFEQAEDQETIINFMTNHKELERQVFDELYKSSQTGDMSQLQNVYEVNVERIKVKAFKFLQEVGHALSQKGSLRKGITSKHVEYLLQYIYGNLLQKSAGSKVKRLTCNKILLEKLRLFEKAYRLPVCKMDEVEIIDDSKFSDEQLSGDKESILQIALALKVDNISHFVQSLSVDNNDKLRETVEKIEHKYSTKLKSQLNREQSFRQNYEFAKNQTLGCLAECDFCGARCMSTEDCSKLGLKHKTDYHRPMAFKGKKLEDDSGRVELIKDYCTSAENLASRWNKPEDQL